MPDASPSRSQAPAPDDLDGLLVAAATDPAARPAFTRALLAGDVFVLGHLDPPPQDGVAGSGARVEVVGLSDAQGPLTPFYTSEAALNQTIAATPGTDPRFLRMGARDFLAMTQGARLVLNPHSDHGKYFLPDEVADLLAGREPGMEETVVAQDTQVLVGTPAHVPPGLTRVLADYLATRPVVDAAHLGWVVRQDGRAGYLLLVVADDAEAAMAGFGSIQVSDLLEGEAIEVTVVPPSQRDHLLASVVPFYRRGHPSQRAEASKPGPTPAGPASLASRLRARFGGR